MNPISVSQMGIALVPPCRDVQWVGPVQGGIAAGVEHSRATPVFAIPTGFTKRLVAHSTSAATGVYADQAVARQRTMARTNAGYP
jgi:hypothetical protein